MSPHVISVNTLLREMGPAGIEGIIAFIMPVARGGFGGGGGGSNKLPSPEDEGPPQRVKVYIWPGFNPIIDIIKLTGVGIVVLASNKVT